MSQFPATAIDTYTPAAPTDSLASMMGGTHSASHNAIMDAIIAVQTKLGIDNSADASSLDYKIRHTEAFITAMAHIATVSTTITTSGINTTLPTNFNLISGTLGIANGLNDANTAQNALGVAYMALATIVVDLIGKFNTLNTALQAQGLES